MGHQRSFFSFLLLGIVIAAYCSARPVAFPEVEELWGKADLVAVIRPLSIKNASDKLNSAGSRYGDRDPKYYQALETRFEVVLVMKQSQELLDWQDDELTLLHFRYAPSSIEFNGGMFMHFDMPPVEHHLIVNGDASRPVNLDSKPTYLAFLIQATDGRFYPVTGHYDSEQSFRMLVTPIGGAARFAMEEKRSEEKVDSDNELTIPKSSRHRINDYPSKKHPSITPTPEHSPNRDTPD